MTPLSLVHVLLGLAAVIIGLIIFGLRKGDPRHRGLGWLYVTCLTVSLAAIIFRNITHPTPFHGYGAFVLGGIMAAVLVARFRSGVAGWRSWHGALMSFSMLAAVVAIGGVVGGVAIGIGSGPAYYSMFNLVIACFTGLGLWLINTRPVIWGASIAPQQRRVRLWFSASVITISAALVFAQWRLFQ